MTATRRDLITLPGSLAAVSGSGDVWAQQERMRRLKTATALDITVPPTLLARADEVVD